MAINYSLYINYQLDALIIILYIKKTTSSVNDCTVEDVELLTSPTECWSCRITYIFDSTIVN